MGRILAAAVLLFCAFISSAQYDSGPVIQAGTTSYYQTASSNAPIVQVAAGLYTMVLLRADGSVLVLGEDPSISGLPIGTFGVKQVSVGQGFAVYVDGLGRVAARGLNTGGQTNVPSNLPPVRQVSAGQTCTLCVTTSGTVVGFGTSSYGVLNIPAGLSNVVKVACGWRHGVALRADGTVVAWGDNTNGQTNVPAGLSGVVDIAAGAYHTVALKSNGTASAWGLNSLGQSTTAQAGVPIIQVAASDNLTTLLRSDGRYYLNGKIALDSNSQPLPTNLRSLTPGTSYVYWQYTDGTVAASALAPYGPEHIPNTIVRLFQNYAIDENGQILTNFGAGTAVSGYSNVVQAALNLNNARIAAITSSGSVTEVGGTPPPSLKAVAGGPSGFIGIRPDGSVVEWENNHWTTPTITNAVQVVGSTGASAALLSDGSVQVWGTSAALKAVPSTVHNVVKLVASNTNIGVLKSDGTVVVWGPTAGNLDYPPTNATNLVDFELGFANALAKRADGTFFAWGGGFSPGIYPMPPGADKAVQMDAGFLAFVKPISLTTDYVPYVNGRSGQVNAKVLLNPAPTSDATVTLTTNDPSEISTGVSVVVPAGSHSVTFPISLSVANNGDYQVTASYGGNSATATLAIRQDDIDFKSLTPYASAIQGGTATKMVLTLSHAPSIALPIRLTPSTNVHVPSTVTIPAGSTSAVFDVQTNELGSNYTGSVTASGTLGRSISANLTLLATHLKNLYFYRTTVNDQLPDTGVLTLDKAAPPTGLTVQLLGDPNFVKLPSSVFFAPGQSTATFNSTFVANFGASYSVAVAAAFGASTLSTNVTVDTFPSLPKVTMYASSVPGGTGTTLLFQLTSGSAPAGGLTVSARPENSSIQVPATFTIPAGKTSVTAPVTTSPVPTDSFVYIGLSYTYLGYSGNTTAFLTIKAPRVASIGLSTNTVQGGNPVTGTITLTSPAPSGGMTVQVPIKGSTHASVAGGSVVVPAGATSVTFTITTTAVTSSEVANIGATINGLGYQQSLTITP